MVTLCRWTAEPLIRCDGWAALSRKRRESKDQECKSRGQATELHGSGKGRKADYTSRNLMSCFIWCDSARSRVIALTASAMTLTLSVRLGLPGSSSSDSSLKLRTADELI